VRQFPVFFNVAGARVVVFGGGEEARRKVRLLAASPAEIIVISETLDAAFAAEFSGRIEIAGPAQAPAALAHARFAIVALADDAARAAAIDCVRAAGIPLNVVDHPDLCDFAVPTIIDRGDIVGAIGSGGSAPVLAKAAREKLEAALPQRIGELAALAGKLRAEVKAMLPTQGERRLFWERALTGPAATRAYAGDLAGAEAIMRAELRSASAPRGSVQIVGAGPGDPELLTLKALRLIQEADIVYYDRLVSAEILALIRRDAARVPVGKSKGDHSVPQDEIETKMIASAMSGLRVVRLKGGDPFIFGRGGEEVDAVRAAGIDVSVVPGISAALGCAASALIPLTHRDHAQSLTFVTGHAKAGGVPALDWIGLARGQQTVVVFMGVGTAGVIAERLIEAGRAPQTPVAVIENGTRTDEVKAFGILEELPRLIVAHAILGPALLIIGDVAALAPEYARVQKRLGVTA
jgi:uroporphyrin-III C-methyltransferase / precorrin-2 dehydrogenase / sirohydrochlorin ferrochelatase